MEVRVGSFTDIQFCPLSTTNNIVSQDDINPLSKPLIVDWDWITVIFHIEDSSTQERPIDICTALDTDTWAMTWPDNDLCSCDKTRIQSNQYKGRGIGRYRPLNGQLIIHSSGSRKGIMRIIRNLDPETLSHSDCHKHNLKSLKMTQNLITFNVRQKNYYRAVQLLLIDTNVPGRSAETWSLVSPSVSQNYPSLTLVACSLHKRCQMRICLSMVADL